MRPKGALTSVQGVLHSDLDQAPKLPALQQLLQQCGIATVKEEPHSEEALVDEAFMSSGHRVLVFAQFKRLLDIVESDVIKPMGAAYLRLDGRWAFDQHVSTQSRSHVCSCRTDDRFCLLQNDFEKRLQNLYCHHFFLCISR